jgi:hypothetical protein
MYLSTLNRVITALGGHLRITADFGGLPISIKGFSSNSVVLDKIAAKEFRPFLKRASFRIEKMDGSHVIARQLTVVERKGAHRRKQPGNVAPSDLTENLRINIQSSGRRRTHEPKAKTSDGSSLPGSSIGPYISRISEPENLS